MAVARQAATAFMTTDFFTVPFLSDGTSKKYDPIADESIFGNPFMNLPLQGNLTQEGSIDTNLDVYSSLPWLQMIFDQADTEYTNFRFETERDETTGLSLAILNSVNCLQYANIYPKSLKISGGVNDIIKSAIDVTAMTTQVRAATSAFPTSFKATYGEVPKQPLTFPNLGGTNGYFRIGPQSAALDSGDDLNIESFEIEIITGYSDQRYNSRGILTPLFAGGGRPSVSLSFKIPRYSAETFQNYRDDWTKLQIELYLYSDATNALKIQFPNVVLDANLTDDDITGQDITVSVGRNGINTTYVNSNMTFWSPIKMILTN